MSTGKLTAKDFRHPLLKVLGQLTNYVPNVAVSNQLTYAPIFTIMGITRDQFGTEGTTGSFWTERWIQWTFKWLVDQGLGKPEGRGKWCLTPAGVQQAQALAGLPVPAAFVNLAVVPPSVPVQQVLAPVATSGGQAPVAVVAQPVCPEGMYHTDPYIRHLALADHACMGFHSAQSPICPTCPAREVCLSAQHAKYSQLAAALARADEAAHAPVAVPVQAVAASPTIGLRPATGGGKIPAGAKATFTSNQSIVVCRGCKANIDIGADAAWVRVTAADGIKDSAMYHRACYDEALK